MKDLDHLEEVADDLRKLHEDEQGQAGSERYKLTEAANQSVSAIDQEFKEKAQTIESLDKEVEDEFERSNKTNEEATKAVDGLQQASAAADLGLKDTAFDPSVVANLSNAMNDQV